MSRLLNNFFWLFGTQFLNTLVNFLFAPFLARSLSYESYASYGQVNIITELSVSILSLGISSVVISYLHLNKSGKSDTVLLVFNGTIKLMIVLGLLGTLGVFLGSDLISKIFRNDLNKYLKIASCYIPILLLNNMLNAFMIYNGSYKKISFFLFTGNLLKVGLIFISIVYFKRLDFVFYSLFVAALFMFLGYWFSLPYKISFDGFSSIKKINGLIYDGFVYYLTGLLGILLFYVDGIIVSNNLSVKDFSIYRMGAFELPLISTVYSTIGMIILPEVAKLYSEGHYEKIVKLKRRVIESVACVIFPVAVFIFIYSKEIIVFYLGIKYEASSNVFWIYNILLLVRINDYADILIASRNYRYLLRSYVVAFIINLISCFILTRYFGIIGASVSTVFSVIVVAFFQAYKTTRLVNTSLYEFFGFNRLFLILLIPFLILIFTKLILNTTGSGHVIKILIAGLAIPFIYYIYVRLKLIDGSVLGFIKSKLNKYVPGNIK